ncbi:MAG: hypothetical protein AAF797_10105 [Planctomycetota bacterium]
MQEIYRPDQVHHVVSHGRVFHLVVMPAGDAGYVGWCLEFPNLTKHGPDNDAVLQDLAEHVDTVYRDSV